MRQDLLDCLSLMDKQQVLLYYPFEINESLTLELLGLRNLCAVQTLLELIKREDPFLELLSETKMRSERALRLKE